MKKIVVIAGFVMACTLVIISYLFFGQAETELANGETNAIQQEDFILHIRVENVDEGFQVFRALQYVGEGSVEIKHHTPLISVSFKNKNHDYTGSTVTKPLNTGISYHPQSAKRFKRPSEGTYTLFCEASFTVNDQHITIDHQQELVFN